MQSEPREQAPEPSNPVYPGGASRMGEQPMVQVLPALTEAHTGAIEFLQALLHRALEYFPELARRTVTLGLDSPDRDRHACVLLYTDLVLLAADQRVWPITVYYELAHLAIHRLAADGIAVPTTSERYCSLLGTARMPGHVVRSDRVPYLAPSVGVPRGTVPAVCRAALYYHQEHQDYCQQAQARLAGREGGWQAWLPASDPATGGTGGGDCGE